MKTQLKISNLVREETEWVSHSSFRNSYFATLLMDPALLGPTDEGLAECWGGGGFYGTILPNQQEL